MQRETANFSRPLFGSKKTAKVEARVSDELKELVRRHWMDQGFESESEWLENIIAVRVLGEEHVRTIYEQRMAKVCGVSDKVPADAMVLPLRSM
jgi:hypothetical protein